MAVDGEKIEPKLRRRRHRPLNGVADVEQLHVQKDALVLTFQIARQIEPAAEQEFEANLVKRYAVAKRVDQHPRGVCTWHIKRDDEFVFLEVVHVY